MGKQCKIATFISCSVVGLLFLGAGCVLIHIFNDLIHSKVEEAESLAEGTDAYKAWQKVTVPVFFQVWMFDVVNYMEVANNGEKPVVVQMGPYTYREQREKWDLQYDNDLGTVTYRENKTLIFDREKSAGPETDTFHCVNLPMLTILSMLKYQNTLVKMAVEAALKVTSESLFTKLSVADLMWGYDDPLLTEIHKILDPFKLNITIPGKFGLFYGTNGSDDGLYTIHSGVKGTDNFGQILSWNGQKKLNIWTSDIANAINGSDGTLYPPFISTNTTKYLFSSDLGRSLGMEYTGPVTIKGIDLDRFMAPASTFGNLTVNPYNAGFCTPAGNCLPSGLLNVSALRQGAPVVMSMPHFLGCDPKQLNAVRGLNPKLEEHSSFLDLEPMTGVVMNAGKKLQINVYMDKIDGFKELANIKPIYFPVMWLNESAELGQADADKFKSQVLDTLKITDAVQYGLIATGGFILMLVLGLMVKARWASGQSSKPQDLTHLVTSQHVDDDDVMLNGGRSILDAASGRGVNT